MAGLCARMRRWAGCQRGCPCARARQASSAAQAAAATGGQPPCARVQVDRLFDWQAHTNAPIQETLDAQKPNVRLQFQKQLNLARLNLNEQGARPATPACCLMAGLQLC